MNANTEPKVKFVFFLKYVYISKSKGILPWIKILRKSTFVDQIGQNNLKHTKTGDFERKKKQKKKQFVKTDALHQNWHFFFLSFFG